jgi:hypothetical protein
MNENRQIEYLIKPDGTIIERVINGSDQSCLSLTSAIETALGEVLDRELQPEYYENNLILTVENTVETEG